MSEMNYCPIFRPERCNSRPAVSIAAPNFLRVIGSPEFSLVGGPQSSTLRQPAVNRPLDPKFPDDQKRTVSNALTVDPLSAQNSVPFDGFAFLKIVEPGGMIKEVGLDRVMEDMEQFYM